MTTALRKLLRFGDPLDVNVEAANVTIDEADAYSLWFRFGGAPSADRTVTMPPVAEGHYYFSNDASTDATVTVQSSISGGTTIELSPGENTNALYDRVTGWRRVGDRGRGGAFADRPASAVPWSRYTSTDSAVGEWVYDGALWRPMVDGIVGTQPPAAAGWTAVNSASVADQNGALVLTLPQAAGVNLRAAVRTAPAAPYTLTACISPGIGITSTVSQDCQMGLCFRESSTGKMQTFHLVWVKDVSAGEYLAMSTQKFTNHTTYSASYRDVNAYLWPSKLWLRLVDDNTNRKCQYSIDGRNFLTFHSVGRTDFFTANQIGISGNCATDGAFNTLLSWAVA